MFIEKLLKNKTLLCISHSNLGTVSFQLVSFLTSTRILAIAMNDMHHYF